MEKHTHPDPPWILLLHAIHLEWREEEIMKGRNLDPEIERWLRKTGKWPASQKTMH
jgi:hypothetical protein